MGRDLTTADKAEYGGIVREVYAIVSGAGKAARVDTFNGNYGLLRGLAAAFVALVIVALVLGKGLYLVGVLVIPLLLAVQRMHRFAVHYATELFTQRSASIHRSTTVSVARITFAQSELLFYNSSLNALKRLL